MDIRKRHIKGRFYFQKLKTKLTALYTVSKDKLAHLNKD
jgi:hypothetical protein